MNLQCLHLVFTLVSDCISYMLWQPHWYDSLVLIMLQLAGRCTIDKLLHEAFWGPCTFSALPMDVEKSETRKLGWASSQSHDAWAKHIWNPTTADHSESGDLSGKGEFCKMADNERWATSQKRSQILFDLGIMSWKWMAHEQILS